MPTNNFEPTLVRCFNRYFTEHRTRGFAYRLKQSRFLTQFVDIVVDSPDPSFYGSQASISIDEFRRRGIPFERTSWGYRLDTLTAGIGAQKRPQNLAIET